MGACLLLLVRLLNWGGSLAKKRDDAVRHISPHQSRALGHFIGSSLNLVSGETGSNPRENTTVITCF